MQEPPEWITKVEMARSGSQEAFAWLVSHFQDMAYGYAFAILGDYQLAEDAAQEAFIEAYRNLSELREAQAFPAWFKRIVYKYCDRILRRRHHQVLDLDAIESLPTSEPGPVEMNETSEVTAWVRAGIQSLPVGHRVATSLYYINGYSYDEIAGFLDIPTRTVKSRLYAARKKLKDRMVLMLQDEFKQNALPDGFTRQTLELAIAKAGEMNEKRLYAEAESLLRDILKQVPEHPEALKEMNRTLMHGQVYGHGRWDLLPELVQQGRTILKSGYDLLVSEELASTLLAVPAVPEAIQFLQAWIESQGPGISRLGKLAWAYGAAGEYDRSEALWQEILGTISLGSDEDNLDELSFISQALVDCFAAAGELVRARHVAQAGWDVCSQFEGFFPDVGKRAAAWLSLFLQADLEIGDLVSELLAKQTPSAAPRSQAASLCLRAYVEDPYRVLQEWRTWASDCIARADFQPVEEFRLPILRPLRQRGLAEAYLQLSQETWAMLEAVRSPDIESMIAMWNWERFNYFPYADLEDWQAVERVSWRGIEACGYEISATGLILAAAALGKPVPQELMAEVEQGGVSSIDEYGLCGWYMLAREAAAVGKIDLAFENLDRSVSYWSNPPLYFINLWRKDAYWGALRDDSRWQRIFASKRERIGPIYGMLHYFPGW